MGAYKQTDRELILTLMKMQENTAPITLSIGYTDRENHVRLGVLIHEAPPVVVNELISQGYSCDLTSGGMFVYKL